jgi:membrane protein implicated in regulation of membrane protease activity
MYGIQGRIIAAIAALAGVLSAIVASAQAAGLWALVPEKYAWVTTALPILSLFIVGFSERLQGGASLPEVRLAAAQSDSKNEREALNR